MSGMDPTKYDLTPEQKEEFAPQALSQSPVEDRPPELPAGPAKRGCPVSAIPAHLAKPNCNKCYGRGWTARTEAGFVLPCRCVLLATDRLMKKAFEEATKK